MTWHIIKPSIARTTTRPMQIAKISSTLQRTADARLRTQYWDNNRIMIRRKINDTYDACSCYHTHTIFHTIHTSTVDSDKVIALVYGIADNLGRYKFISRKLSYLLLLCHGAISLCRQEFIAQALYLLLKVYVTLSKLCIQVFQREISLHLGVYLVSLACYGIGSRKPRTTLIAIILKE